MCDVTRLKTQLVHCSAAAKRLMERPEGRCAGYCRMVHCGHVSAGGRHCVACQSRYSDGSVACGRAKAVAAGDGAIQLMLAERLFTQAGLRMSRVCCQGFMS